MWVAKSRVQNQGHCYSKREEAACDLLFLNNITLFLHLAFCNPYFGIFFKVQDPIKTKKEDAD